MYILYILIIFDKRRGVKEETAGALPAELFRGPFYRVVGHRYTMPTGSRRVGTTSSPVRDGPLSAMVACPGKLALTRQDQPPVLLPVLFRIAFLGQGLDHRRGDGACAAGLSAAAGESSSGPEQMGNFYLAVGMIAAFLALIGGLLELKKPKPGAIVLLVGFVFMALSALTLNPMAVVNTLLLLLATVFGFVAKAHEPAKKQAGE